MLAGGEARRVDVLVIGGGVVGCAILRELCRYDAEVALVEGRPDLGDGASKANSAIVHTGFDAPPGSLEARLLADSRQVWPEVIESLRVPYLPTGALMVAADAGQLATLRAGVLPKAARNGVPVEELARGEVLASAPHLSEGAAGGALIAGEGVIDPFWLVRAYAESAMRNGAAVARGARVTAIAQDGRRLVVSTDGGPRFSAALVVNAAGLWADEVASLAGDRSFRLAPRKGQFLISEEDHGVGQILLPVPSATTKGILVTPIVFGGILLGPTAEDVEDKCDLATTAEGLAAILAGVRRLAPSLADVASVRQFAGLRAVYSGGDYLIRFSTTMPRLLHVAGIRSTGISASPGIGRHVASLVGGALGLTRRSSFVADLPEYLAGAGSGDGEVVCLCRAITRGEILAALRAPLPPTTLDGLKRRTGAMLGDCQGNLCLPRLLDLFQQERAVDALALPKHAHGSQYAVGLVAKGGEEGA